MEDIPEEQHSGLHCGCPNPGIAQDQLRWGLKQPGLVEGVPHMTKVPLGSPHSTPLQSVQEVSHARPESSIRHVQGTTDNAQYRVWLLCLWG